MPNFKLIFQLLLRSFSLKKGSLRYPTIKRIAVVFFIFPLILLHILWSQLCLLLDNLCFPNYRFQSTQKAVFIVGLPRSGTSFLLNLIAQHQSSFTSFRLWEMVFAPSIIQKLFWLKTGHFLTKIGFSTKAVIKKMDGYFFHKIKGIHQLGLHNFEEDELLLMYYFQSVYLIFLFPELEDFHQLAMPDNSQNLNKRKKLLLNYQALVQRHLYVFDKTNNRYFLSKNPMHIMRLKALTAVFPNAHYLVIQRPLEKSIASTISLNQHLYNYFCTPKVQNPLRQETIDMLFQWANFQPSFLENASWKKLDVDFKTLIKTPSTTAFTIHEWLGLNLSSTYQEFLIQQDEFSKRYKSSHTYEPLTEAEITAHGIQRGAIFKIAT